MGAAAATMPGMEYRVVNPAEWIERAMPLLRAHWGEVDPGFTLEPDVTAYQRLHDAGLIFAVAAFDGDALVGYCSAIVVPPPHNPSALLAMSDALYVVPALRRTLVAGRLMRCAEAEAAARGARRFVWACRAGTPLAPMLERHGYTPLEHHMMKEF